MSTCHMVEKVQGWLKLGSEGCERIPLRVRARDVTAATRTAAKRHVAAWGIAPDALASTRVSSACDSMLCTPPDGLQNSVEHRGGAWSLQAAGGELLSAGTAE